MTEASTDFANALTPGADLLWYTIQAVIGQGAFGITYLADDTNLNRQVAIKEYLPGQLATRDQTAQVEPLSTELEKTFADGLQGFITEARTLARFEHPNIVGVHNIFEANNTAYMVMQYEDGRTLAELVHLKGTITADELEVMLMPLLSGLEAIHQMGFVHRDIKPANVFIRNDGSPVLLDFGSARQSLDDLTQTLTNFVSHGYAPIEQYTGKSDTQGAWTDIYGLGATLYRAISGERPSNSIERGEALAQDHPDTLATLAQVAPQGFPPAVLATIDQALQFRAQDRPNNIATWRQMFIEAYGYTPQSVTAPLTATATIRSSPKVDSAAASSSRTVLIAAVLVLTLLGSGVYWWFDSAAPEAMTSPTASRPGEASALNHDDGAAATASQPTTEVSVDALLTAASKDIRELRLTTPAGNNAYEKYRQVIATEPDNRLALEGLKAIASQYLALTYRNIESARYEQAAKYINKARELHADEAAVEQAETALAAAADNRATQASNDYLDQANIFGAPLKAIVTAKEEASAEPAAQTTESKSRGEAFLQNFGR